MDWEPTYSRLDPQPYGSKSVFELMPNLLGNEFTVLGKQMKLRSYIKKVGEDSVNVKTSKFFNLYIVRDYIELSDEDLKNIKASMELGGHVFLCANSFSGNIKKEFGFKDKATTFQDTPDTALHKVPVTNVNLDNYGNLDEYLVRTHALTNELTEYDLQFQPILTDKSKTKHQVLAIRRNMSLGQLTIACNPKLFTNIHALYQCPELVQFFYSKHPNTIQLWANEYKSDTESFHKSDASLLSFINKYPNLRWAWNLFIIGSILFLLNFMRRIQKPVQAILTKRNKSLEFVKSIAMLYRKSSSNVEILRKKVDVFNGILYERYDIKKQLKIEDKAIILFKKSLGKIDEKEILTKLENIELNYQSNKISNKDYIKTFENIESLKKHCL